METRFQYDLSDRQLRFHVRQRANTEQKLEFKATALLDPSSGTVGPYRAAVKQYVTVGSGTELKGSATKPFRLGAGLALASSSATPGAKTAATRGSTAAAASGSFAASAVPLVTLSAEKKVALLDGPNTVLTLRAATDADLPARRLSSRRGLVKVSHTIPSFTKRQDLKLSAGLTVDWAPGSRREPRPSLFLQARENNWAVTYKEGRATVTYDL
ncbi:hypothetical protein CHLRE_09g416800v5 [Chlamydomonas reinhardtii]|uniref:Uncharacterized protein n=1 Tax=Chlamydomonas reinhardtii TaxID=3055 RepID=A8J525_CHLRE|nr:uncharacterized protein CHLRE_09g416800v5 [Chlamydomonas reinhardtii]PNW79479.1 hypothetical protein CHLRE_09g416800v5 [Chlamydomonas reinhardtii]|eukprot:XP_001696839.1 predicted protein [Chlamydomonas reinhardtii]